MIVLIIFEWPGSDCFTCWARLRSIYALHLLLALSGYYTFRCRSGFTRKPVVGLDRSSMGLAIADVFGLYREHRCTFPTCPSGTRGCNVKFGARWGCWKSSGSMLPGPLRMRDHEATAGEVRLLCHGIVCELPVIDGLQREVYEREVSYSRVYWSWV